jgi:hypothetical protein
MIGRTRRALLPALFAVVLTVPLVAHNPLLTAAGVPYHWPLDGTPVGFVIHEAGVAAIPDLSDDLAIRRGVLQWELSNTLLDLHEDHTPEQRARTDYWTEGAPNDLHLLIFDETAAFFGPGSNVIAVTPVWSYGGGPMAGTIVDADILFNAAQFEFSTDLKPGTMDLEAITAHEAGHLVGFGHSGLQGSTMVPTASYTTHYPRSISQDDAHGVRTTYLGDIDEALVTGGIVHLQDGSPASGLSVWARELSSGRVLAQTTTHTDGSYELRGLPEGRYELSAMPYDGPIFAGSISHPQIDLDVGTTTLGVIDVPKKGIAIVPPSILPPIAVGTPQLLFPGGSIVMLPGQGVQFDPPITYIGNEPADAAETLSFSAPRAEQWFDVSFDGSTLTILSADDTPPGWYDILGTNAYGMDVYPGVMEIVPPPPVLETVSPNTLGPAMPTELTLTGSSFQPQMAVHIGDRPATYVDLLDTETLRIGVPALTAGTWDVTLIDERSGRETRLVDVLEITADVTAPILRGRQKLQGRLTGTAETDVVYIEGLPEALLSVTVKGDKKDGLFTRLVLRAPTGEALVSNDSTHPQYDPTFGVIKGSSSRIRKFPLPVLGVYALEISAVGGTTGRWTAAQKQKVPPALRRIKLPKSAPAAVAPGAPALLEILAPSHALISGKLSSKDGAAPVLEALEILGVDFADTAAVSDAIKVSGNGRSIRFKNLRLPAFGLVELKVATGATAGTLTGKLIIKPPAGKGVLQVDV